MRRGRQVLAAAIALAALSGDDAFAASGDLKWKGCISGETESTGTGTGACDPMPLVAPAGAGSGMNGPSSATVSPDGKSLYVSVQDDSAIYGFARNKRSGELTPSECITGDLDVGACSKVPGATTDGVDSGLDGVEEVLVSPDGESVYLTGQNDSAVVSFKRNRNTGGLSFQGCVTGDTNTAGSGCEATPFATAGGFGSGLAELHEIAIAPDGDDVYAVANDDDSVVRFKRKGNGSLDYHSCLTGDALIGPAPEGSGACKLVPGGSDDGVGSGLDNAESIAISSDGKSLYATGANDDAVSQLSVAKSGAVKFKRCITGDSGVPALGECVASPEATPGGTGSGLGSLEGIVASRDGKSVYVTAKNDEAVTHFSRAKSGGKLTFEACYSGDTAIVACEPTDSATAGGADSGMSGAQIPAVTPNGESVYVPSEDGTINHFKRKGDGSLKFASCVTAEDETAANGCEAIPTATASAIDSGLDEPEALAVSPDSKFVYAAAQLDDAVAILKRK